MQIYLQYDIFYQFSVNQFHMSDNNSREDKKFYLFVKMTQMMNQHLDKPQPSLIKYKIRVL